MAQTLTPAEQDFYTGIGIGRQWADTVQDAATRERFVDSAVMHCLPANVEDAGAAASVAKRLAASILGVPCDDDAASAFWFMIAPGVDVAGMSQWFFEGFVAGAADLFSRTTNDEFGELRKLVRDPPRRAARNDESRN